MITKGEYSVDNVTYGVIVNHNKSGIEVALVVSGTITSAYKSDSTGSYSYNNVRAKDLAQLILSGTKGCTAKNGVPSPFELGAMTVHEFIKTKIEFVMCMHRGEVVGASIQSDKIKLELEYCNTISIPNNIPYVKLTEAHKEVEAVESDLDAIQVRSVEEIALEKEDITWLKDKKYYIVNDDAQAEQIFNYLENYDGEIAYDTETTGLKMNCFGKIGSKYAKTLKEYNEANPDAQIRADKLVGIIFCVEHDVSYYFPCFNRKFKNLYEDHSSPERIKLINNIRSRYTIGDLRDSDKDMTEYIMNTPDDELDLGVLLMERVRNILTTKHLVAHNGTFEWKVGHIYGIDTNIKDDTMLMHKIMYKFRSTTSNRGEPSDLKYLAKRELGMDQWELKDFFPGLKDDKSSTVREKKGAKKKKPRIDFSYMTYEGSRVYAPTDGDVTLQLFHKYKKDLIENHKEMHYIYEVEVIVSMAIAYMEFYGHRLNESKINNAKNQTIANLAMKESEIRQAVKYADENELKAYEELKNYKEGSNVEDDKLIELCDKLNETIRNNTKDVINLSAPGQVADLFFDKLGYPLQGEKKSVAKNTIKALIKEKNEDGSFKYPVANLYSLYKNEETLLVKFFDNLQYFAFPGGFVFSSYGQIAAATGRMSCNGPNAQQYPKSITKIVYPRDGYVMLDADYSQIEYRVLTALAKNDYLAELFSDPDSDYHTLMASLMYDVDYASVTPKMRSAAKSFNFGIPYGMGMKSLAILLNGNCTPQSVDEAKEKYEMYFKNQPKTRLFFDNVKEMAQINGWTRTVFNRYRYYSFVDKDGNVNNARKAAALRQAGNAIIQGSAADIFKIGVARNFNYIRKNKLFGKLLIVNMIHDEQLLEINTEELNVQRVVTDICKNMQFKLDGFPPLFVGAGLGMAWGTAKGKLAEIHPVLLSQLTEESGNTPIFKREGIDRNMTPEEVVKMFDDRIHEFCRKKIADYLGNRENWHKNIQPAIGSLINLKFNYGRGDEAKSYKGPNGEKYTDQEFLELNIGDFLKENNIQAEATWFKVNETMQQQKEEENTEDEYDEGDSEEIDDIVIDTADDFGIFSKIDESNVLYGSSIQDLIDVFGACMIIPYKICGIDIRGYNFRQIDSLIDYLVNYICDENDDKASQVVFLKEGNVMNYTGYYIKGIKYSELETQYKLIKNNKA